MTTVVPMGELRGPTAERDAEPTPRHAERLPRTARNGRDLLAWGLVDADAVADVDEVTENFAMAVTSAMLELIDVTEVDDPIRRQFVPTMRELVMLAEERADPIGDEPHEAVDGVVHRYPDRALLKAIHVCPVYCRFCFRREKVGPGSETLSETQLEAAFVYIRSHPEIWEVILTGGDPLILKPRRLGSIVAGLDAIPTVEVIRIHTRVPVVAPARVTDELVTSLKVSKPVYVVLHCNHPRELTEEAVAACGRLVDAGIPMLNQSVLLRGVNDDKPTMEALLRALVRARVKPYYLHHGDLALGTSHFRTTIEEGQALMRELRGRVSGICQPTYVLDIPGGYGKVPIGPNYLAREGDRWRVEDIHGDVHLYPPRSGTSDD
jgi:lysine 2,3-aminomutase